jgi:hypothetical protein
MRGGDGVRLTLVRVHSLAATKIAVNVSKLDIVKRMAFKIVRLRFYKVALFSGNVYGNERSDAKETKPCTDPVTGQKC